MPRKVPAKKSQPTASKKKTSRVKASSKNRPAKPKRSAPASKSKSSGDSIDALVKKQLTALKQADTLFKDAVSIVEIYRKKHPELEQYIPSVASTQREINVRGASSEDSNSHYRFHIDVVDGDPKYGVAFDQEEPSYLDPSEWQKQFHVRLAKTIATIIAKRGSREITKNVFQAFSECSPYLRVRPRRCAGSKSIAMNS
jgi:hypothetical protein